MFFLPFLLGLALFQWSVMGPIPIAEDEILRLSDQSRLTVEQLVDELATRRVVLVGEAHDNPAHHRIQLQLIERLHARRNEMVVAMEMFPRHLQPQLDRWVAGEWSEEQFLDEVEWYFTWGFDVELYAPILRFAKERRIPLLAMNIRRETVSAVRRKGLLGLEQEERDVLPPMCPAPLAYRLRLEEVFESHPMMSARGHFDYFVEAQGVWDGVMADSIKRWSEAHPGGLVVGLAGSGHLVMGHGIVHQLRSRGVEDVVTVLPWVGAENWIDREAADWVWGTPETPESDAPVQLGVTMDEGHADGVWVKAVVEDSLAARAGLRPKDHIRQLNGQVLASRHTLVRLVRGLARGTEVVLLVDRSGQDEELRLRIP